MLNTYEELFKLYYRATVGKFFTVEQSRRLFSLLSASNGMDLSSDEYHSVCRAVETVEAYDIKGFVESKNLQLFCGILEEDEAVVAAATALSSVFEELQRENRRYYASIVDRTIALRTANPRTNEVRMELAFLEYATGDLADTKRELAELVDRACFDAVGYLAYLSLSAGECEAAYHYYTLMARVIKEELELAPAPWIEERRRVAGGAIPALVATEIARRVAKLPPFFKRSEGGGGAIGFHPTAARSFTYEC